LNASPESIKTNAMTLLLDFIPTRDDGGTIVTYRPDYEVPAIVEFCQYFKGDLADPWRRLFIRESLGAVTMAQGDFKDIKMLADDNVNRSYDWFGSSRQRALLVGHVRTCGPVKGRTMSDDVREGQVIEKEAVLVETIMALNQYTLRKSLRKGLAA
jgi:hypothetical protein